MLFRSEAVKRGITYRTAGGEPLPNLGEVAVQGVTSDGNAIGLTMQVVGVKKPLGSVQKLCDAGNRVVFENSSDRVGGYVQRISTGTKVPILRENGTYTVSIWTKEVDSGKRSRFENARYFVQNVEEEEDHDEVLPCSDFPRHA